MELIMELSMIVGVFRPYRATIFSCFGCSGVVPTVHVAIYAGWTVANEQSALQWFFTTGAIYGNIISLSGNDLFDLI